jgi:molecular chaperone DnaJ
LRYDVEIDLEEAHRGSEHSVQVPRLEVCSTCRGSGAADPASLVVCDLCGGRGVLHLQQGFFSFSQTCNRCRGSGRIIARPCATCQGSGRVPRERSIRVRIPSGVEDGTQLRIAGEGEAGPRGSPSGHLYVVIHVKEHPYFKREGRDLYSELPITFSRAFLGGEVKVRTLDGVETVKIPEGVQTGSPLKLKGKGMRQGNGSARGDHYLVLRVVTPKAQRAQGKKMNDLFRELAELEGEEPSLEGRDLFDRVKDFFA